VFVADDDGSGTVTTLEAFTILCESGFKSKLPVEFHWYSAEEMGLLGSQDVSSAYQRSNVRYRFICIIPFMNFCYKVWIVAVLVLLKVLI
jgi:Zn-dependent M28 family amino/carboxypeptidase